jgi:hypothetical protein
LWYRFGISAAGQQQRRSTIAQGAPMATDDVSFEEAFANVSALGEAAGREPVSPALELLLHRLYDALEAAHVSAAAVKAATVAVLRYLTTPEGRTDANCWAVNMFMIEDWGPDDREILIGNELHDVLADMGGALHDTIEYPQIAENFCSTPEQLLQRAEVIDRSTG